MNNEGKIYLGLSILVIFGMLGIALIQPYFEMKSFNECTHSNASYMNALFTELRAFECKK